MGFIDSNDCLILLLELFRKHIGQRSSKILRLQWQHKTLGLDTASDISFENKFIFNSSVPLKRAYTHEIYRH